MPDTYTYIIRAAVDAADTTGMFPRDLFNCGVNDRSEHYPSADAALIAARATYKGPDVKGARCRVWAEREASDLEQEALI
jgi:hypothetical protein